ncbi:hypothetical protein Tco_0664773 [Tanacetum coccineum]
MIKESHPKEVKTIKMAKAKENVLNVEIQIISSESVQNYQETTIKEPSLEDHGVIATKMKKKGQRTKNVSWLKHLMRYFEDYYSEDQYAVSIKEDTAYPCMHSPKTTEDEAQYAVSRENQYAVFKI